jgi:hypothetical protein
MFHCSFPHRFSNRAACFIAAYREGLLGPQAAWANKKYHGHRMLPPESILKAKNAILPSLDQYYVLIILKLSVSPASVAM